MVEKETSPKYYFMDTGLLGLMLLDCKSAQLENLVAIELIRRYGVPPLAFVILTEASSPILASVPASTFAPSEYVHVTSFVSSAFASPFTGSRLYAFNVYLTVDVRDLSRVNVADFPSSESLALATEISPPTK